MKISTTIVSSLEKCRPDLSPCDYARLEGISALGGERINFQFIVRLEEEKCFGGEFSVDAESGLDGLRLRSVKNVYTEFDTFIEGLALVTDMVKDHADQFVLYATWGRKTGSADCRDEEGRGFSDSGSVLPAAGGYGIPDQHAEPV